MRLAYTDRDGGVTIVIPASKADIDRAVPRKELPGVARSPMTEEEYRAFVVQRSIPPGVAYVELPDDYAPDTDRRFRAAWRLDAKSKRIIVDMDHARALAIEESGRNGHDLKAAIERAATPAELREVLKC